MTPYKIIIRIVLFLFLNLTITQCFSQAPILLIGTYDSQKSEGIYLYHFNEANGTAKESGHIKTSNPSFISVSSNKKFVFAVNENADKNGKGGTVTSFVFNKKAGILTKINSQSSEGNNPCYLTIDKRKKWLIAGNYSTGNAALFKVNKNGFISRAKQLLQYEGKSIDTARQLSPHVHATLLNEKNNSLFVTDLGTDKIMCYNFDEKQGKILPKKVPIINIEEGSGPRHLILSNNEKFIYLLTELKGTVVVFKKEKNNWKNIQKISSVPLNFTGVAGSADIHISVDGNFLYVSNRGVSNSIGIFKINKITGKLILIKHQSTLGLTPRNFNFDPSNKYLLVANQNSDEVVIFKRNIKTGMLTDTGNRISVGKPVCLKWL